MAAPAANPFLKTDGPVAVRGFLHQPDHPTGEGLVLSHGAGSDARAPLLVKLADIFATAGFVVLRIDLPFRQDRAGSPHPSKAPRDREGIRAALDALRELAPGPSFLAGHSYGGRQTTMLAAEQPELPIAALMLCSYPLHPPGKPEQLRTAHFSSLKTPALFIHGSRDPFGSTAEMEAALPLISAKTTLLTVEGAGHDLDRGRKHPDLWAGLPARLRSSSSGFNPSPGERSLP
jgi:predicted alpha/beta-hydrolase family hydrolase